MPSGGKQMVINTLERALSVDVNRLQLFLANDRAEMMRQFLNVGLGADDFDAGGVNTQGSLGASPMQGEILNGFCVRPQLGASGTGLDLHVDPGVMWILPATDSDPDSSAYKYVRDPGLPASGTLLMTANASGSIRIDIVECAYNLNTAAETDNRDIFNPATGTFTASNATKATQAGLTYRVRLGTPGSGIPATAAGWMPLAVASVPTGTTTNATITFWDVRPLVADRVAQPFNVSRKYPKLSPNTCGIDTSDGVHSFLEGVVDVVPATGTRRLGGFLARGTPGADGPPDLNVVANWADTISGSGPAYVYLLEPFGLPRWARYTDDSSGNRQPRNPRGIPVISMAVAPTVQGTPASAVSLPASTGLGGTTTQAVCIAAPGISGGVVGALVTDGSWQYTVNNQYGSVVAAPVASDFATVTMTSNVVSSGIILGYPAFARRLRLALSLNMTNVGPNQVIMAPIVFGILSGASIFSIPLGAFTNVNYATGSTPNIYASYTVDVTIPLTSGLPAASWTLKVKSLAGANLTFASMDAKVAAWGV